MKKQSELQDIQENSSRAEGLGMFSVQTLKRFVKFYFLKR
jgi:hypothetical protein